jgi:AcrR family transcriptional regulator
VIATVTPTATTRAGTADRILDAAEALVAAHGVDAVSLRSINTAAGANVAAAHYHFGSKDAVLEAVLRRRMDVLAARRAEMLASLEREASPSPRAVVATLVQPLAEFASTTGAEGDAYVGFLAALSRSGPTTRALIAAAFAPQYARFVAQLRRALPEIPTPVLEFRLALAGRSVIEALAEPGQLPDPGVEHRGVEGPAARPHAAVTRAVVDYVTGALGAPIHAMSVEPGDPS